MLSAELPIDSSYFVGSIEISGVNRNELRLEITLMPALGREDLSVVRVTVTIGLRNIFPNGLPARESDAEDGLRDSSDEDDYRDE